jgi:DNA polymerase-1
LLAEIPALLEERGVKTNSSPKYEADDLIGISSKYFSDKNKKVIIYSGDKDFLQLVNENIEV